MKEVEYIIVNKASDIVQAGSGLIASAKYGAFQVELRYDSKMATGFSVDLFARLTETGYYALSAVVTLGQDTPAWVMTSHGRTIATVLNMVRRKSDHFDGYRYTETAVMDGLRELGAAKSVAEALKGLRAPSSQIRSTAKESWK
jgi:hypothetical protein